MSLVPNVGGWASGESAITLQGTIGGPIKIIVNSGPGVLASQRVQFNGSFNEVWAETAGQSALSSHIMCFDKASAGFLNDNIHLLNPGATSAFVTVSLGSSNVTAIAPADGETYVTFGSGSIGGPVTISVAAGPAVLAAGRVEFNSSFNEVLGDVNRS